uniref:Ig-like domain-containing protein n=1 Tax=Chelonoidis abingdonii TaxID=106734 RepID=A0A8C0H252_CHEAB
MLPYSSHVLHPPVPPHPFPSSPASLSPSTPSSLSPWSDRSVSPFPGLPPTGALLRAGTTSCLLPGAPWQGLLGLTPSSPSLPPSGLHSRRVLDTVVSKPGPGLPWFSRVVFVDDQVNYVYTSGMQRAKPGPLWMAQPEGPEFWDERTLWGQRWQTWFNMSLNTLSQVYSRGEGFHIIQTMFGCDLREDNTVRGFYQDSYDGRDFLTFDKETMTWVAADIGAQITKRRWDAEINDNQGWKHYLEETCISWLRNSLEYGKETLQRKGKMGDMSSHDGLTTLSCTISGFYPRDITVTWLKNGESRQQETYSEGILPSGDGTYQTWVTMEIDPKIKAHYSCHVEHESLLEPFSVPWDPCSYPQALSTLRILEKSPTIALVP